jgi:hypothetical protein
MADINLLSTDSQKFSFSQAGTGAAVKILAGVLILVVAYYGYLRWQVSRVGKSTQTVQAKTRQVESDTINNKQRAEVVTRQGQVNDLDGLIKNHVYWSGLLPELARVTLKSASYAAFDADTAGTMNLTAIVTTYADADKIIQVFDLPQFNQQFSDVKILSLSKIEEEGQVKIKLILQLKFNPTFIRKTL